MLQTKCYRTYLKNELAMRCSRNTNYSLRSFARDLELSYSQLSLVLNQKRGLSLKVAQKISESLGLTENEKEYFLLLVEASDARSLKKRKEANLHLNKITEKKEKILKTEDFHHINQWYYLSILELTKLDNFEASIPWIANALGVTQLKAKLAIESLANLGLINFNDGKLEIIEDINVSSTISSKAIKNFHDSILDLGKNAIYEQGIEQRDFQNLTIAFNSGYINEAKEKISQFVEEFNSWSEKLVSTSGADKVYNLEVIFFNLLNKKMNNQKGV